MLAKSKKKRLQTLDQRVQLHRQTRGSQKHSMLFALGYIAGIVTAVLLAALMAYFKSPIERTVHIVQRTLENAGPHPRGFLMEPEDEGDEARRAIVDKNKAIGRDTPISELL